MSDKRSKKNTTKNNKKTLKNIKILTLRLDNGNEIPAKIAYTKDDTKYFKVSDIDINKIRVSGKKLYKKEHNSYKYYVFYERDDEYILLKIISNNVVGYYNVYEDSNSKKINFSLNDELYDKIFEHIQEKLEITFGDFTFVSRGEEYIKTIVSKEASFRKGKGNIIPRINTTYTCRVLLRIESVYFVMEDNKDDIKYYPQVLLEQCVYKVFSNNTLIFKDLEFTDTEPDSESERETDEDIVFDENTVFDE